ncbi:MAG: response regulator transcription factor [Dehalococcoidia bacterium]
MSCIRVLIVDDHEKVRPALIAKLGGEHDLQVMGTAASTDGELEEALQFEPDVVLLDVKRNDGEGLEICHRIVRARPSTRVLILTSYPDAREKREVLATGAAGYLLKDLDFQELLEQIKAPLDEERPS